MKLMAQTLTPNSAKTELKLWQQQVKQIGCVSNNKVHGEQEFYLEG